jgi:hypothetical protein
MKVWLSAGCGIQRERPGEAHRNGGPEGLGDERYGEDRDRGSMNRLVR